MKIRNRNTKCVEFYLSRSKANTNKFNISNSGVATAGLRQLTAKTCEEHNLTNCQYRGLPPWRLTENAGTDYSSGSPTTFELCATKSYYSTNTKRISILAGLKPIPLRAAKPRNSHLGLPATWGYQWVQLPAIEMEIPIRILILIRTKPPNTSAV